MICVCVCMYLHCVCMFSCFLRCVSSSYDVCILDICVVYVCVIVVNVFYAHCMLFSCDGVRVSMCFVSVVYVV